jgi:hypothetical protein
MIVKKSGGHVIGADLTAAERKAMRIEIQKQLAEDTRKHAIEIDAMFLWYMYEEFGLSLEQLKQLFMGFAPRIDELCNRYEMYDQEGTMWLCTHKLKEMGVDLEEWDKERGD